MKKIVLILSSVMAVQAMAQEGKTGKENTNYPEQKQTGQNITPQQQGAREYYVFKDKKLWHIKDNLTDEVKFDVTLSNGTKLTTKGEVISKTGKHEILEEGQCVDMTAEVSFCQAPPRKLEPEKKFEAPEENIPEDKVKGKKMEPGKHK